MSKAHPEEGLTYLPVGARFEFIMVGYVKAALETVSDPRDRLDMLEWLEGLARPEMPLEAIVEIQPLPPVAIEICDLAFTLDRDQGGRLAARCSEAFKILTGDTFHKLATLCPSFARAAACRYATKYPGVDADMENAQ